MEFKEQEAKPTYSKSILLVIDADSLVYKAAHVGQKEIEKNEVPKDHPLFQELAPNLELEQRVILRSMIDGIVETVRWELNTKGIDIGEVQLHYTPKSSIQKRLGLKPNFRYALIDEYNKKYEGDHPGYKSGRKGMALPDGLDELFEFAVTDPRAVIADGCEADDVVAYLKLKDPNNVVIACIDKDIYNGVPSGELDHFNFNKQEWICTTEGEAITNITRQCLTGDSSDSIKGIHRYGPKTAEKDIADFLDADWTNVLKIFEEKGYTKEYAVLMMRLVRMDQFNGEEVTLWQPPEL